MYNATIATTRSGPVRGLVLDDVHVFKGIRYGMDTGAHRFLPPRPPQPWADVHNAFAFGPTAPQDDPDTATDRAQNPFLQRIGLTDNLPESEDCLFLNVWTPAVGDGRGRPVMVWVHSGAFATNSGSSPAIDGSYLARTGDVVVLTFNHHDLLARLRAHRIAADGPRSDVAALRDADAPNADSRTRTRHSRGCRRRRIPPAAASSHTGDQLASGVLTAATQPSDRGS